MKQIIFFLCLSLQLQAQVREIPREYRQEYRQEKRENRKLEKEYDVTLPPQIALPPSAYSQESGGNWGYSFLQVREHEGQIASMKRRKVAVFIFDTAGKYSHPGLKRSAWNEMGRVFTGEASPEDGNGHSTHVAGIIAGEQDSALVGICGVLVPDNFIKVIPYKVLTNTGGGQYTWIEAATRAATAEARKLISAGWFVIYNFSLGGPGTASGIDDAIRLAEDAGVLVMAASGNEGREGVGAPANGQSAHAIAALDRTGQRAYYSTYGKEVYLAAPGTGVYSTYPPDLYRELSGTSMATPAACAISALVASVFPTATNRQISRYIAKVSTDIDPAGWDKYTGFGAPLLGRLLSGNPNLEPDTGNGNPQEPTNPNPPTRETRKITYILPDGFPVVWKPLKDTGPFRRATVYLIVEYETNKYAEDAHTVLREYALKFFNTSGFLLRDRDDFADAVYWARHFFQVISARDGHKFRVTEIRGQDERGREVIYTGTVSQASGKIRLIGKPEIQQFFNQ